MTPGDDEFNAARKRRNVALALALAAFMVLVFVITIVKLGVTAG